MAKVIGSLYPTKSLFGRILFTLIPFAIAVSLLYSFLVDSSIGLTEDHILSQYLSQELRAIQQFQDQNGELRLPQTSYLRSFTSDSPKLPQRYKSLSPGLHEFEQQQLHLAVADIQHKGETQRIILELDEDKISAVDQYDTAVNSILIMVAGLVIIASTLLAVVLARRLSRPIIELAEDISSDKPPSLPLCHHQREDEIGLLSREFGRLLQLQQGQLEREKSFSRHASHEIRTPIALIRNAAAVLVLPDISQEKFQRNLQRIDQACQEAEQLLNTFLQLGQETKNGQYQTLCLEAAIAQFCLRQEQLIQARGISIQQELEYTQLIACPDMFRLLLHNLLGNGVRHGQGRIIIRSQGNSLIIENPIARHSHGHSYGYGLEIVKRICHQLGWQFEQQSLGGRYICQLNGIETA